MFVPSLANKKEETKTVFSYTCSSGKTSRSPSGTMLAPPFGRSSLRCTVSDADGETDALPIDSGAVMSMRARDCAPSSTRSFVDAVTPAQNATLF
jgi:hypothetical protein